MKKIIAMPSLMRRLQPPKTCGGGGVKAFVLVALAAEKDDDGNQPAVSAMSGKKIDIIGLVSDVGKDVMKDIVLKDLLSEE